MEDRHLSLSEVSGSMGVSERTVRRWIKSGKLKAYKPGRDYRIPESAVREFVEESEVYPKAARRSSLEPSLFNGILEEERREATYGPWRDFVNRFVDRWEKRIKEGTFDRGSLREFEEIVDDLLPTLTELGWQEKEEVPPEQWGDYEDNLKLSPAIGRLLFNLLPQVGAAAADKFKGSELEQIRQKRAEQEAALNAIVRRGA
jgi:excisionase family DNA binding protein